MQNVGNSRRREQLPRHGLSMLSLYNEAPLVEVSLEQFEEFAIDRLHVLKAVENYRLRSVQMKDREGKLEKTLNKHMPLRAAAPMRTGQAEDDTAKDVLSHFFLRMAFCQTEELRRWFLTQENTLFR
ncbi:DNA primase [Phytophthora megakarya]|uniref:DNA primase n=1 Tax=Phytophthora megakarya TaxID=4795 RepID=A0A225UB44_9STRA|nr:DNA primase [Phytophthora megakarya]